MWHLLKAGSAKGRPEAEQDHLPLIILQGHRMAGNAFPPE
jgi:hypothetical protein